MVEKRLKPGDIRLFGHYEIPCVVLGVNESYGYNVIDYCGDYCVYHFNDEVKSARGLSPEFRAAFEEAFRLHSRKVKLEEQLYNITNALNYHLEKIGEMEK